MQPRGLLFDVRAGFNDKNWTATNNNFICGDKTMMKRLFHSTEALAVFPMVAACGSNAQAFVIITAIENGADVILSSTGGTLSGPANGR